MGRPRPPVCLGFPLRILTPVRNRLTVQPFPAITPKVSDHDGVTGSRYRPDVQEESELRSPRFVTMAVTAAAAATVLATSGATSFAANHASNKPPADSLGSLASKVGLRIGTAVDMGKLNVDATYTGIVANQFTTVTPENVMKWDTIEPAQGQLNFGPADELVAFARA